MRLDHRPDLQHRHPQVLRTLQAEEMEKAAQSATDQQKPQVNEQAGEKEKPAEEKTPEKPAEPEKVHL